MEAKKVLKNIRGVCAEYKKGYYTLNRLMTVIEKIVEEYANTKALKGMLSNRPDLEDEKYWGDIFQGDGIKSISCRHEVYQNDLNLYIDQLESNQLKWLPINKEEKLSPIQDALYSTGRFTQEQCTNLAEGIYKNITDNKLDINKIETNE